MKFQFISAIAIGTLLGLIIASSPWHNTTSVDAATISVDLKIHPGATNTLNCGWHVTCDLQNYPDSGASGLDWHNTSGGSVYWRSYGYRSDGMGYAIGQGLIELDNGSCYSVRVKFTDAFGFVKGYVRYVHSGTWTPGWPFTVNGGGGSGGWTSLVVAFTNGSEMSGCSWSGPHLHQEATSAFTPNMGLYPWEPTKDITYPVTTAGYHQHLQSWIWNY